MTPGPRLPLRRSLETAAGLRAYARRLFATIADRDDLITVLLSYGQDRRWKRQLADLAGSVQGRRVLDLACGTGDIAFAFSARGAAVTGLDLTHRMLQIARARAATAGRSALFVTGDMLALPFADAGFDMVTLGYGLRNVPEQLPAIREIRRVLKPGGVMLSLDFDRPANPVLRTIYLGYLTIAGSLVGLLLHRDPDTSRSIPESIRRYPGAPAVAALFR